MGREIGDVDEVAKSQAWLMINDNGYTAICAVCGIRHGGPVFGERTIDLRSCEKCEGKLNSRFRYGSDLKKGTRRHKYGGGGSP